MSFRHDSGLLVRSGEDGVAVVEGFHHIPDKVNELIGFGLTGEAADLHDTAESADKSFTLLRMIPDLGGQTDHRAQRIQSVCISIMDLSNCTNRITIFQCLSDLFTSHIELTGIILIEITGQGAERFLGGEGERSSCSRHNHAEPME